MLVARAARVKRSERARPVEVEEKQERNETTRVCARAPDKRVLRGARKLCETTIR